MKLTVILAAAIASVSVSGEEFTPIYSPSYANVYYQRSEGGTTRSDKKFNLPAKEQEELVANQGTENEGFTTLYHDVNPTSDPDATTEPDSEKVPFNSRKHTTINPLKSKEAIELTEELEPFDNSEQTDSPDLDINEFYYIYHPNGLLQKVVFATKNDPQNMEYSAQFSYQNVQPILEPIYTYDPNTFAFQRLQLHSN